MNWLMIVYGALGGLGYSISGLANKDKREGFNIKKMGPTLIVSTIAGGVAGFMNVDYGVATSLPLMAGVTVVVEKLWKAIYRKAIKKEQ